MIQVIKRKLPALLFSLFLSAAVQAQKVVKKFIKKYEHIAVENMQKHNIPASIILGVSIVESAAGMLCFCMFTKVVAGTTVLTG